MFAIRDKKWFRKSRLVTMSGWRRVFWLAGVWVGVSEGPMHTSAGPGKKRAMFGKQNDKIVTSYQWHW